MAINIQTKSGGEINLIPSRTGILGDTLYIHIDQTANIKSGEDEATIGITPDECKNLIRLLNEFLAYTEGKNYIAVIDYTNSDGAGVPPLSDDTITPDGEAFVS